MTSTNPRQARPDHHTRSRALLAGVLMAVTIAGAVAARVVGPGAVATGKPVTPSAGPLRFSAPTRGPVSFTGQLDRGSVFAHGDGIVKMELAIRADEREPSEGFRIPTDLVVILDRSGSMNGAPLQFAKAAVRELIGQLAAEDRFALVTYASGASLAIPLTAASPAARDGWLAAVNAIGANGGTNMASGIDIATAMVERSRRPGRAPRVILVSDGHANEGDHSLEGLRGRAARAVAGEYVLSTVGVGSGFDETLMTVLADAGAGNFYYLHEARALAGVFGAEFASARETVASALAVTIEPAARVELLDAAGYPLERKGDRTVFYPGSLFSGQERRVWVTLRAPAAEPGNYELARFSLQYVDEHGAAKRLAFPETPRVACVEREEEFLASIDDDTWARSVIADEYSALKQRVSGYIQAGKQQDALAEIESYRKRNRELNAHFERRDVARQLEQAEALGDVVRDVFVAGPEAKNELSKKLAAEGLDGRRVGSKQQER